jgi:hypothetical protein
MVVALAMGAGLGCGGYTVGYEGARGPRRAKADIAVFDVECRDPVSGIGDCTHQGQPLALRVLGVFRVPSKATSNWSKYRGKVLDAASAGGCPAVALRTIPPVRSDGAAVGAFCVEPRAAAGPIRPAPVGAPTFAPTAAPTYGPAPTYAPAPTGAPTYAPAPTAPTAPTPAGRIECNGPADCPPGNRCVRGVCGM